MEFGKKVKLVVYDKARSPIFSSEDLRVDFDIRIIQNYGRALFTVYNLNNETIRNISNGERYIRIFTSLHGHEQALGDEYYISNAITEKKVPDQLTLLYCVDSGKRDFTDKQISMAVKKPSLRRTLHQLEREAGTQRRFEFVGFPEGLENQLPAKPTSQWTGSVGDVLSDLGKEYGFTVHQEGQVVKLVYQPTEDNVHLTNQGSRTTITLATDNMKSNPKIGVAQLEVESNLDPRFKAGVILDTSKLLTASTGHTFEQLTVVDDMVELTAGRSQFNILSVTHKGSTHTKDWTTTAVAIKTARGKNTTTYNWAGER